LLLLLLLLLGTVGRVQGGLARSGLRTPRAQGTPHSRRVRMRLGKSVLRSLEGVDSHGDIKIKKQASNTCTHKHEEVAAHGAR